MNRWVNILACCIATCCIESAAQTSVAQFAAARQRLIQEDIIPSGVTDARVLKAIEETDRHEFVPHNQKVLAYQDMALPIGSGQTISSPFIVAFMTCALDPQPLDRVLEIGTGSGYQAAVLSPLVKEVFTIEIVASLGRQAERTLQRLKYRNVHVRIGDGYLGWSEHAPYDKIIVTCSPEKVPQPLIDQLREGGKMVVPVGERYQQTLYLFTKSGGQLQREALRPTLFVPMTGAAEAQRQVLPDSGTVTVVNGFFDQAANEDGTLPGWYYQRQVTQVAVAASSAAGTSAAGSFAQFTNETPGLGSRALQGLAVDGRRFRQLNLSAKIKYEHVVPGPEEDMVPSLAISFYDQERVPLGQQWLGPWTGSQRHWQTVSKLLRVPKQAREAILRVGLFGAHRRAVRGRNPDRPHTAIALDPTSVRLGDTFGRAVAHEPVLSIPPA